MINATLNDPTQKAILEQLQVTENLLAELASTLSGRICNSQITAMPDLGFPLNIKRFRGGFYTGAYYSWETDCPFVPVDATVNCCGVSVFRLSGEIESRQAFDHLITKAESKIRQGSSYSWNFNSGNHFITYSYAEGHGLEPGFYAILHSSASEFKNQYNGLYPTPGNWFYSEIKTICSREQERYLRYIDGKTAERFFETADMVKVYNTIRHRFMAHLIFGENNIADEVLNIQHYGMPNQNAIAIGCNWLGAGEKYLLLSEPGQPLFLIQNDNNIIAPDHSNRFLTPHGLGMQYLKSSDFHIINHSQNITINGTTYSETDRLLRDVDVGVRSSRPIETAVEKVLDVCTGHICGKLYPVYSYDCYSKND